MYLLRLKPFRLAKPLFFSPIQLTDSIGSASVWSIEFTCTGRQPATWSLLAIKLQQFVSGFLFFLILFWLLLKLKKSWSEIMKLKSIYIAIMLFYHSVKDSPRSIFLLFRNPVFVCTSYANALDYGLIAGLSGFGLKYLESMFGIAPTKAAYYLGKWRKRMRRNWIEINYFVFEALLSLLRQIISHLVEFDSVWLQNIFRHFFPIISFHYHL